MNFKKHGKTVKCTCQKCNKPFTAYQDTEFCRECALKIHGITIW